MPIFTLLGTLARYPGFEESNHYPDFPINATAMQKRSISSERHRAGATTTQMTSYPPVEPALLTDLEQVQVVAV
jgi:hypothetical protein